MRSENPPELRPEEQASPSQFQTRQSRDHPSRPQVDPYNTDSESNISRTSFKHWHRHMQNEHLRMNRSSFTLWECCNRACRPCRWFDTIGYDRKICKCCFKFRTFKSLGTMLLLMVFFYVLSYTIFKDEVLPGGTLFFLYFMCLTSYATGYIITLIGLPPMLAYLVSGIVFKNLPANMLPSRDEVIVDQITKVSEQVLLVVALIRGGLLLDMSRIKNRLSFILRLSIFPFFFEFVAAIVASHFLLSLPWDWSALQGSVMSVVSLASVTSIMHKNKCSGYGEEKSLSTVLIAAAVLNVIAGLFCYAVSITYTLPEGPVQNNFIDVVPLLLEEIALGLSIGGICGFLISFFPDKRNTEAAAFRILLIGLGSFALTNVFSEFNMIAAAALGCLTLCVIATNMWEELGWHNDNNPVQYFYTMVYYFCQPIVMSLVGYSMDFKLSAKQQIGLSAAVVFIGLTAREIVCFLTTKTKLYPTNINEKFFICIAWITKGTFQVLLATNVQYVLNSHKQYFDELTFEDYTNYAEIVKETTVIAILLTTPIACISLTLLTPVLLTKSQIVLNVSNESSQESFKRQKRLSSIKYIEKYSIAE